MPRNSDGILSTVLGLNRAKRVRRVHIYAHHTASLGVCSTLRGQSGIHMKRNVLLFVEFITCGCIPLKMEQNRPIDHML